MQDHHTTPALALAAALLFSAPVDAAKFYKCTDAAGETQYQQEPCGQTGKQDKVHVYTGPRDPSDLGWQPYQASADEPAVAAPMRFRAQLANALSDLSAVKMAVAEYHIGRGAWPERIDQLGFAPEQMHSSQVASVELGADGAIVAHLTRDFGPDKRLVLRPSPAMGGTTLEWQCQANFPAAAMTMNGTPVCESRALR